MNEIILVGGFHEVIELAEENQIQIRGIIDKPDQGSYRNYEIMCDDEDAGNLNKIFKEIPILISPDNPHTRKKLYDHYLMLGFGFFTLISSKSHVSNSAFIGKGTIIQYGVNISAEVSVGEFVKLNTMCNVMHNSKIGDFTTIAPNAVILGNVVVGQYCYIGSNSTVLPNISICDEVTVGAGAVVTKSLTSPGVYVGSPAKLVSSPK